MKLLLVKHSNSNHNPDQQPQEWALTEQGIARCKPLSAQLAAYQPERLFASTMPKAQHTAELVAKERGDIPVVLNPLLQEHSRKSNAPYVTQAEFEQRIKQLFEQPYATVFGDETALQAQQRFTQGVTDTLKQAPADEHVVVIAHGTVNTLFTMQHNAINAYQLWSSLKMPSIIVLNRADFRLETIIYDAGVYPE